MAAPLHERERELEDIVEALDGAAAGRGRVVLVEGPAGIGKTSLLDRAGSRRRLAASPSPAPADPSSSRRTPGASCASCSSRGCAG